MRNLAAEAGVSAMTVSLALRNSPGVSEATRARIQRLAGKRGYRPDPTISRLMEHLRGHRNPRFRASLCGLTERWPGEAPDKSIYRNRVLAGLRQRADAVGYGFELVYLDDFSCGRPLQHMLYSRGIEGLVILPLLTPRSLAGLLDWSLFSTVTVTSSVTAPRFHSVIPQHFDNMLLACKQLTAAGCRSIGLVLPKDWDVRVNHRWAGAVAWQNQNGGTRPIPPFFSEAQGLNFDVPALKAWITREKPEIIVSDDIGQSVMQQAIRALPVRRRPRLVTMNWSTDQEHAGIDQRVEEIGSTAINILASMILHSERGIPTVAQTTMIMGQWVPGDSSVKPVPRRAVRRPRKDSPNKLRVA